MSVFQIEDFRRTADATLDKCCVPLKNSRFWVSGWDYSKSPENDCISVSFSEISVVTFVVDVISGISGQSLSFAVGIAEPTEAM